MRLACAAFVIAGMLPIPETSAGQSAGSADRLRRARELVVAGRAAEAIPIYEALVDESPKNPALLVNLAVAHFKAENYAEVIAVARAALDLRSDLVPAWLFLGASHAKLGQPSEAIEPLRKVLAALPEERNARLMLAEALLRLEQYDEAAEQFRAVSAALPDDPRVWYGLERCYTELAGRGAAQLDQPAYVHALLGDARFQAAQFSTAFYHYRQALRALPSLRGVHASLAAVYEQTGHQEWAQIEKTKARNCTSPEAACRFLEGRHLEVIASSDPSPETVYWRTRAYRELADQACARLSALPASAQLHELQARRHDQRARYLDAAGEWRKALQLAPGTAALQKGLAVALYHGRDFEAALPLLKELLDQDADSAELHFLQGSALLFLERPDEAVQHLETALKHDPDLLAARAELGRAYMRLGQPAAAVPHIKAALPIDDDGTRRYQLVRAYQASGEKELAQQALSDYREFRKTNDARLREIEEQSRITAP